MCSADRLIVLRDQMLWSMFCQAVKLGFESIAMQMVFKFESALLRAPKITVGVVLASLRKKNFCLTEIKLSLLQMLQPSFMFRHADDVV